MGSRGPPKRFGPLRYLRVSQGWSIDQGGVAAGVIEQDIPANSTELVVDGLRISNSETVQVFCSSSSAINIIGHVNRLS